MRVDRYERLWMWAATAMLAVFVGALLVSAVAGASHPPSHTEVIDPDTLTVAGEFASPGVVRGEDGRVTVAIRAEFYVFLPARITVPARVPVTFRVTSPDVLHGFQIVGTNVNLTVAPGYVSQQTVTFETPGEYLIVCNEYCGLGHHDMHATLVVEAPR